MGNDILINVGKRIQEIRRSLGLSQKDFAEKAGINAGYLSEIENGLKENPGYAIFYKISSHYRVSLDYLFYGSGNMFLPGKNKYNGDFINDVRSIDDVLWLMDNSKFYKDSIMGLAARFFYENEKIVNESIKRSKEQEED